MKAMTTEADHSGTALSEQGKSRMLSNIASKEEETRAVHIKSKM
jgi:hypothetical protein